MAGYLDTCSPVVLAIPSKAALFDTGIGTVKGKLIIGWDLNSSFRLDVDALFSPKLRNDLDEGGLGVAHLVLRICRELHRPAHEWLSAAGPAGDFLDLLEGRRELPKVRSSSRDWLKHLKGAG